ncbi:hypothetical protein, partial [Celeribacter litoreus]|uniref:hypothetical protein n=1 Tax=Celeribacter litoreus TaxID=2876714 RepID=UPI001CCB60ED
MPFEEITTNLVHDHSVGLEDSDIAYNDGTADDLETRANSFYQMLVAANLITDGEDETSTYGDRGGVGASTDDWVSIDESDPVNELRFAADSSGAALDGDIWTDPASDDPMDYVRTSDTGEIIYLYAVEDGTVLVGSTTSPDDVSWGGELPDSLDDFETSSIAVVGYLDAAEDNKTAEVYWASFRPITNPDETLSDGDTVDLGDNVWLYADTSRVLTFSGLDPKKFLFGLAGEDAPDDSSTTKIFVLGEDYNVDTNEDYEKGGDAGAMLNTSSAGKFPLYPDLPDVATVGVNNQSVNEDQGIFVMLVDTDQPVGNYYNGTDADDLDTILSQDTMSFGIVQAVGNTGVEVQISGYDGEYSDGADLIVDNGASDADPDSTLGDASDVVGIEAVSITWTEDVGEPVYEDIVYYDGDAVEYLDLNGRTVTVVFSEFNAEGQPTLVTLNGVAAYDLIEVQWVDDVDHALLHTNLGAIDWGIIGGEFGGSLATNIGEHMLVDDAGPTADVTDGGTEPDAVYLFDGNTTVEGNYEGADGTGYPTGDA